MIVKIPGDNNKFVQTNTGEIGGTLWATWNMDLTSNPGRIRVSQPTTPVTTGLTTTITVTGAFLYTASDGTAKWWAISGNDLFKVEGGTFVPASGVPTGIDYKYDDLAEYAIAADSTLSLFMSYSTGVAKFTGGVWDSDWYDSLGGNLTSSTETHPLCAGFNNLLLIGNGNYVAYSDNASTISNTRLTFPNEFKVVWIKSSNSEYYIGCRNTQGREAKVFVWDGYSQNFNDDYKVGSPECFAGIIKDEVCYCVNGAGQLLAFNGGGFSEVARFPIKDHAQIKWYDANNFQVFRNGMALINNNIHILVNAHCNSDYMLPNFLSGIWEYTKENGLYHKYSMTKDTGAGIIDYGSPAIDTVGALVPIDINSGSFYAGAYINTAGANTQQGFINRLSTSNTAAKVGYFITPKIQCSEIEEEWQKLVVLIKKLLNATDKIYVKYKVDNKYFGDAEVLSINSITWVDSTKFTCETSDVQTYTAVGDEIEIMQGEGSGLSTNVTAINGSLFTIDETVTDASGAGMIRVSNWKKIGTDIATQEKRAFELPINDPSSWIQFKVVCFFTNLGKEQNEIERLILKSQPKIRI